MTLVSSVVIRTSDGEEVTLATRQDVWDAQAANVKLLTAMHETIKELRIDMSRLTTDIGQMRTDIGQIRSDAAQTRNDVARLTTNVSRLSSDVTGIKRHLKMK